MEGAAPPLVQLRGLVRRFREGNRVHTVLDGADATVARGEFVVLLGPSGSGKSTLQWRSPRSGVRYPSAWRITVPAERLDLVVTPIFADQELDLAFRYWEGAVDVEGRRAGEELRGVGYVELTGYEPGRGGRARSEPGG